MTRARWLLVGLAVLVAGGASWRLTRPSGAAPANEKTVVVKLGDVTAKVSAPGQVMPLRQRTVYTKQGGTVRDWLVRPGQVVQAGQLLGRLDDSGLRAQLGAQEAQVAALQAAQSGPQGPDMRLARDAEQQARLLLDQAGAQLHRAEVDLGLGAIPAQQVDTARTALAQAQLAASSASTRVLMAAQASRAGRAQLQAVLAQAAALRSKLALSEIRAPMAGTLTDQPVTLGQAVAADTALVTVAALDAWTVQSRVAENDLPSLKVGMPVKVTIDALQGDPLNATVTAIGQVKKFKDPVYYYQVDSKLTPGDAALTPGLSATAEFVTKQVRQVKVLPLTALQSVGAGTVVQVRSGTQTHTVPVKAGLDDGTVVAVTGSLKPGDVVILPPPPGSPGTDQGAPSSLKSLGGL